MHDEMRSLTDENNRPKVAAEETRGHIGYTCLLARFRTIIMLGKEQLE